MASGKVVESVFWATSKPWKLLTIMKLLTAEKKKLMEKKFCS